MASDIIERKRIHIKAKRKLIKLGLVEDTMKETKNDDVEQCILDLTDEGLDEDDARAICEELYGDEGDD